MVEMALRAVLYSSASRCHVGGVQVAFSNLVDGLRQRGHAVVAAWREEVATPAPDEWVCPLEFETGRFGLPGPTAVMRGGRSLAVLAARLARFRPAVVNVHYVRGDSLYFLLLRRLFGYRLVLSVHGTDILRNHGPTRRLLAHADAVTVVSKDLLQRVQNLPGVVPERVRLIPNGIDVDFWAAKQRVPSTGSASLVCVGRLVPVKGIDVLIEALARLSVSMPGVRLAIVGEGESQGVLRRQAEALGLGDQVQFMGQLDKLALRALFVRSSLFVLPSRSEGMPLALLEAMAAGLPAVATRVGGVAEVLTPGCGRLVPAGDPDALAGALGDVLRLSDLDELGLAARQRASAFSHQAANAAYERLFLQLREGRP